MLTKTEAVRKSILKWERIITELREGQFPWSRGSCGFCDYYQTLNTADCGNCPLYPDICSSLYRDNNLFWQITSRLDARHPALRLAKRMVKEIRKHGDKWIKESK